MELYPGIFKRVSSSYITKVPFTPPTKEEIKLKYKQLALIRHPDKPTGSDEEFASLSSAYESLLPPPPPDVDVPPIPREDCSWWYNSVVLKLPGQASSTEGYIGNLARVVGITDDGVKGAYMTSAGVAVAILAVGLGWRYMGFGRKRREVEIVEDRRARDGRRREKSRLLRRVVLEVDSPGVMSPSSSSKGGGLTPAAKPSDSGSPLPAPSPASSLPTSLLLPPETTISFASLFPSLQASRTLLRTLSTNPISAPYAHLLPTILQNLLKKNREEKYYQINAVDKSNFFNKVWRYKPFRALLTNLGFTLGDDSVLRLPFPMSQRIFRLLSITISELKGQPLGGGRELPVVEVGKGAEISMDVSMRVACKTKVLFMGGGKATVKGVKEVEGGERFKGIEGLTWKVNSGVVDQMGERWGEKEVYGKVKKIELSRLPYLRRLTSISSLSNLHELCLDMCDLTTLPTLPLNLRRLSASDNSISTVDEAWEGEGVIMLEYVDLRGNLLKNVPGIMTGERMKKLKTARLDGCEIKVDELVKFSMEFKIKLC